MKIIYSFFAITLITTFTVYGQVVEFSMQSPAKIEAETIDSEPGLLIGKNTSKNSFVAMQSSGAFLSLGVTGANGNPFGFNNSIGFMTVPARFHIFAEDEGFPALTIEPNIGHIGLFNSSPAYALDVNGDGFLSGAMHVGNFTGNNGGVLSEGFIRYHNSDFEGYGSSGWVSLTGAGANNGLWSQNGNGLYYDAGNVGVGLSSPVAELHIRSQDALANLIVESPGGATARMFAHTTTAGIATGTNTPLSFSANNIQGAQLLPNKNFEFFGDLFLDQTKKIKFGDFNSISTNASDRLLINGDLAGISMATCQGDILIEAGCEGALNLRGEFSSKLWGHFDTNIASENSISFNIGTNQAGMINGAKNWGIKTNQPVSDLHISQEAIGGSHQEGLTIENAGGGNDFWNLSVGANDLEFIYDGDGPATAQSFVVKARVDEFDGSWDPVSDRRLKKNIQVLENVSTKLMQLKPSKYQFKHTKNSTRESIGFIAQDVQKLFPDLVNDEGEYLTLSYGELSVVAIKAIQEQQTLIEDLYKQLEEQKLVNKLIIARLEKLERE